MGAKTANDSLSPVEKNRLRTEREFLSLCAHNPAMISDFMNELVRPNGTTLRGRKVITRKAAINTEFDKRNSPVQNLLESICTVRGYELGRVKSIRQGHCTEIYARKTRLGRNGRIDELKRPISSSLTGLITIKQIDDTRFRMMGKKSNVLALPMLLPH